MAPAKTSGLLQDSQLFDAEYSEPLLSQPLDPAPARPPRQAVGPRARGTEAPVPARHPRQAGGPRARGMEAALLYGVGAHAVFWMVALFLLVKMNTNVTARM